MPKNSTADTLEAILTHQAVQSTKLEHMKSMLEEIKTGYVRKEEYQFISKVVYTLVLGIVGNFVAIFSSLHQK